MVREEMVRNLFVIKLEMALDLKGGEGWGRRSAVGGAAGRSPELRRTGAGAGSRERAYREKRDMGDSVAGIIGEAPPDYAVKEAGPRTALSLFSKHS